MNILLVGYGKMGKAIEQVALQRRHQIAGRVDVGDTDTIAAGAMPTGRQADVAIEFSQPGAAFDNIAKCLAAGIPVVCGTTGWLDQLDEVKDLVKKYDGTFFYASNYSLGVNIFFKVNEYLAKLMANQQGYEVSIDETHHTQKKDAPSGTAITLREGIAKYNSNKSIPINSFRVDPAPGTHSVKYKSTVDDLEITHTAHSRDGFALGAVLVAEWIKGRKGVFTMNDFLPF